MGERVHFDATAFLQRGAGRWREPAYAVPRDGERPETAVARAIARKNGLHEGRVRVSHYDQTRNGLTVYQVELGRSLAGGGFDQYGHCLFTLEG